MQSTILHHTEGLLGVSREGVSRHPKEVKFFPFLWSLPLASHPPETHPATGRGG